MSLPPLYIWDATSFANPAEMTPTSLSHAAQIVRKLCAEKQDIAPSPKFKALATGIKQLVDADEYSDDFNEEYKDIETRVGYSIDDHLNNYITISKPTRGDVNEIVLVLRKLCAEHNLMLFDDFGLMLMPDGSTYPEEVAHELDNYADILKKRQAGGYSNELPNKRKDFYNLFKAKFDPVMQRYGFVEDTESPKEFAKHTHLFYELARDYGRLVIVVMVKGSGSAYKTEIMYKFYIDALDEITRPFLYKGYKGGIHSETIMETYETTHTNEYDLEPFISYLATTHIRQLSSINSIAGVEKKFLTDFKWEQDTYKVKTDGNAYLFLALAKLANNPHYERYKVAFHASVVQEIKIIIAIDENDHAFNERYRNTLEEFEANWPKFIELLEKQS